MATDDVIVLRREPVGPSVRSLPPEPGAPAHMWLQRISASDAERHDLRRDPEVVAAAPVLPVQLVAPVRCELLARSGQHGGGAGADGDGDGGVWGLTAVGADRTRRTGRGVTVAMLDTGIDRQHPAFSQVDVLARNFTSESDGDSNGHGTHCAGTLAGATVNGVRLGVAPGVARLLSAKVLGAGGGGGTDAVAAALLWAVEQGAQVASLSLGIDIHRHIDDLQRGGLAPRAALSHGLERYLATVELFRTLVGYIRACSPNRAGLVIVAASGNESNRAGSRPWVLNASPPAISPGILAVGAVRRSPSGYRVADFSNGAVDLVGPGVDVLSAAPGDRLASADGTSTATPHVAGLAALWAEALTDRLDGATPTADQISSVLLASATRTGLAAGVQAGDVGLGLPQVPES